MDHLNQQLIDRLNTSQWNSRQEIQTEQLIRALEILDHAKRNVPAYAKLYQNINIPYDTIDWDFWKTIPIIDKQLIQQTPSDFISNRTMPWLGPIYSRQSSGSTGSPIQALFNEHNVVMDENPHDRGSN